jgi:quercetin dioxygenase-like cupin family protein
MRIASLLVVALALAAPQAAAQSTHSAQGHSMVLPDDLKWTDAPSVGPGAKIAVIEGPLNQAVPFTFRLRMPANVRIAPHIHPAYERVTVLSGTLHFAHGDSFDAAKTLGLTPGSVAIMPPGAPMFGYTTDETVIQLHGTGPWGLQYLNPADDPRN